MNALNRERPRLLVRMAAGVSLAVFLAVGCSSHPTDEQIQQQAAQTTQQVKQGAEQAATQAKIAAAKAEDKINAVAAGVKQGLNNGAAPLDLNSATLDQLQTLPGITPNKAHRIVAGRPYATPNDLVTKNVLTQQQFDRISSRVQTQ